MKLFLCRKDRLCQRECSLWGCKYLGLFTKSFTADLFLHPNDLNALCLRLLHGNGFRKIDPFLLMWSDSLQSPALHFYQSLVWWLLDIQTILMWWWLCFDSAYCSTSGSHVCIFHNGQQLCSRLDSRPFKCHCWSQMRDISVLSLVSPSNSHLAIRFPAFPE